MKNIHTAALKISYVKIAQQENKKIKKISSTQRKIFQMLSISMKKKRLLWQNMKIKLDQATLKMILIKADKEEES